MNRRLTVSPFFQFLFQHHVHFLTLLSFLFIVQSGLVPFDFQLGASTRPVRHAFELATTAPSLPDLIANLFLYVPLGMFLRWSLWRLTHSAAGALVLTVALCGALSGAIEWVQAYSPSRVSSLVDLTTNTIGAALGASISSVGRWIVPRMLGAAVFEFRERPATAAWKAYCGLLVVMAAIPFSFSFDAARLRNAVKASVFVPFGLSAAQRTALEQAETLGDERGLTLQRWEQMKRWSRWAAEAASFVVCAWLLQLVLWGEYGFGRRSAIGLTWWFCGLFAVALSVLQLPVVSRGCDVTDIAFRFLGIAVGLVTFRVLRGGRANPQARAVWGAAAIVAYIVYSGLAPFEFAVPRDGVWGPLSAASFLPFMAYFETRFDLMMTDVLEKFAAYGLLAAFLAIGRRDRALLPLAPRLVRATAIGVALCSAIELIQMFLPIRVVSLTDPIVAAAGCLTGATLADHVLRFTRYAVTKEVLGPDDRPVELRRARPLTLTDELIAALADPSPQAPAEAVPRPSRPPVP